MLDPRQMIVGGACLSLALGTALAAVTPNEMKPAPQSELQRLIAEVRAAQPIVPNTALEMAALNASYPEEMVPYSPQFGIARTSAAVRLAQVADAQPLPPLPEPDFEPAEPDAPMIAGEPPATTVEITLARAGRTVALEDSGEEPEGAGFGSEQP